MMSKMESLLLQAWDEYMRQQQDAPQSLKGTLEDLWHKIAQMEAPTAEEYDARLEVRAELSELLGPLGSSLGGYLEAEVHGLFLMGCFTSSSTLEVAVTGKLPTLTDPNSLVDVELRSSAERLALLERVYMLITNSGTAAQGTTSISRTARVPSVSFEHGSSGIPVRVCISYPNFALRPQVVRGITLMEPRLRSLIQLVELWADARGLNNPAAGTFNTWALINLVIFAAQTFQVRPLLPPLWRACTAPDLAITSFGGSGGITSSAGGGLTTPMPCSGGGAVATGSGGGSSTGGASSIAMWTTQRLPGLTATSEGLAPVLRDIMARLTGPPEALGLPAHIPASSAGLLPLFHWFLVLLDQLLSHWQLSWNRRWRVSTWWGQLVQQPFNRAFLVPLECPFDPADNAAKSLGCENQPKHQQVLRGVIAEVAASLCLLQSTRSPEDLDRLVVGMFGLEVEHQNLEEQEEEEGREEMRAEVAAAGTEAEKAAAEADIPQCGGDDGDAVEMTDLAVVEASSGDPVGEEAATTYHMRASSTSKAVASEDCNGYVPVVRLLPTDVAAAAAAVAQVPAGSLPAACAVRNNGSKVRRRGDVPDTTQQQQQHGLLSLSAITVDTSPQEEERIGGNMMFYDDVLRVEVEDGDMEGGEADRRQIVATPESRPPMLPMSALAATTDFTSSPVVVRAKVVVHRPMSPLLRDVTKARQYGPEEPPAKVAAGSFDNPSVASNSASTSAAESPGLESLSRPFEGLFGSLLEGARRLLDNMAQGMAELGEDLNELAATTAATIRAVINDDEDLPFLSSSAALRRQRRQRLQLLHRGGPATVAGIAPGSTSTASPSPASTPDRARSQPPSHGQLKSRGAGGSAGWPSDHQRRASPLHPAGVAAGGGAAAVAAGATPRLKSPGDKAAFRPHAAIPAIATSSARSTPDELPPGSSTRKAARSHGQLTKRRGEQVAAALAAAAPALPQQNGQLADLASVNPADGGTCAPRDFVAVGSDHQGKSVGRMEGGDAVATVRTSAAAPKEATETAVEAEAPSRVLGPGAPEAADATAVSGPPIMLHATPDSSAEHPLAASPVISMKFTVAAGAAEVEVVAAGATAETAGAPLPTVSLDGSSVTTVSEAQSLVGTAVALQPPSSEVSLVVGVQLGSASASAADSSATTWGAPSTYRTSLTRVSTPTVDVNTAPTASSLTVITTRVTAAPPCQPRGNGQLHPYPEVHRLVPVPGNSAVIAGTPCNGPPPPPPPPLPPPHRPPVVMGGLRVKSATFRRGATRDMLPAIHPTNTPSGPVSSPPIAPFLTTSTASATSTNSITPTTMATINSNTNSTAIAITPIGSGAGGSVVNLAAAAAATGYPIIASSTVTDCCFEDPAARTLLQLSSGRLQELAECIDRAGPGTTIDLQGGRFRGPLAAPVMKVTAPGLWLINGELCLSPEQQLMVVAKAVRLKDLTMTDVGTQSTEGTTSSVAAMVTTTAVTSFCGPAGAVATAGGAIRPVVLVTKQSYVGGGELTVTRCRLLLGPSRAIGMQVKGKGCSAVLEDTSLRGGCSAAALQAVDAALLLRRCCLVGGAGQGVSCRNNAAVTLTDCRIRHFNGACVAVLAGGSLELAGCELSGAASYNGDDGEVVSFPTVAAMAGVAADSGVVSGYGSSMAPVPCGPGLLAEGKGSSLVARGSRFVGFRSHAALMVTVGATVSLEDCRAEDSQQGAVVGTRGGRLLAARCVMSSNSSHGLVIGEGATADLRDCRLKDNGAGGLRVGGVGSMAVLWGCELSDNAGNGVTVATGGCANLDGCTVRANGCGAGCDGSGAGGVGRAGHGLHVEGGGARVMAVRCAFTLNACSGVQVGPHGSVELMGCVMRGNSRSCQSAAAESDIGSIVTSVGFHHQSNAQSEAEGGEESSAGSCGAAEGSVEMEVEAHGRGVLSKGCSWGTKDEDGALGRGSERSLRVSELGCLELSENRL